MIFVHKGMKPLTSQQLNRRTQKYIDRGFPQWKRERSIRKADGVFDAYMDGVEADTDINRANNTFNHQLKAYRDALARLEKHILLDGQAEVREMQPTGEQVFNEESGEMEDVLAEVVVKREIEPVEEFVEVTVYSDDPEAEPTVEQQRNPVVIQDEAEREQAQAIVDGASEAVKTF